MQKFADNLPLILLTVLIPYLSYVGPNAAQSVIATALTALVGFRFFLESQKKPDYVKIFTDRLDAKDIETKTRLDAKDLEINEIVRRLDASVNEIREQQGKIGFSKGAEDRIKSMGW